MVVGRKHKRSRRQRLTEEATAFHEAGHAVTAHVLGVGMIHQRLCPFYVNRSRPYNGVRAVPRHFSSAVAFLKNLSLQHQARFRLPARAVALSGHQYPPPVRSQSGDRGCC
jgi:hypothetical protein